MQWRSIKLEVTELVPNFAEGWHKRSIAYYAKQDFLVVEQDLFFKQSIGKDVDLAQLQHT